MFITITAKYPGTCKRCGGPIEVGDKLRYGGKGLTYHLVADCDRAAQPASGVDRPDPNPVARQLAEDF
jgi:hypothetical protein